MACNEDLIASDEDLIASDEVRLASNEVCLVRNGRRPACYELRGANTGFLVADNCAVMAVRPRSSPLPVHHVQARPRVRRDPPMPPPTHARISSRAASESIPDESAVVENSEAPDVAAPLAAGAADSAAKTLSRPPVTVLPAKAGSGSTLLMIRSLSCAYDRLGLRASSSAAAP